MSIFRVVNKFRLILSRHQKRRVVQLAFLMLIAGFLEMCSVSLVLPFISMMTDPAETMEKWYVRAICRIFRIESMQAFLFFMAILLAVIFVVKNMYLLFQNYIQNRFVLNNQLEMQRKLLENFINRPYEYFLQVSSGEVMRVIQSDTVSAFGLLSTLLSFFSELVVTIILVVTIFVITPGITVCIAVVLLLVLLLVIRVIRPHMYRYGIVNQQTSAGMNKWLLQSIQGIKELKMMRKEAFFQKNYLKYGKKAAQSSQMVNLLSDSPRFLLEAVSMGTMFLIVAFYIFQGNEIEKIVPILSAVAMAALRLLPAVNRISKTMALVSFNEPMLDKMIENLKSVSGKEDISLGMDFATAGKQESKREITDFRQKVEFSHISYRYPNTETDILSEAEMTIKRGESIGIVGASGAGKSTAVDILTGLLDPQKGEVLVDGISIQRDKPGWISQIGYIPQSIFMLDDTIKANIAFGEDPELVDDSEIWEALREASLDEFVRSLPKELDTEIGERGVRLSGGQRQRIGIARALYRRPEVLVFDEATSALDNQTEAAIMESIANLKGRKTMIIIAHRLTTIEGCDHVYRVDEHKILRER